MTESTNTNGKTIERYTHALGWRQCARSGMARAEAETRRDRALRLLVRPGAAQPPEPWRVYVAFVK